MNQIENKGARDLPGEILVRSELPPPPALPEGWALDVVGGKRAQGDLRKVDRDLRTIAASLVALGAGILLGHLAWGVA